MQRHGVLAELGWLVYFIVLLVIAIYAVNALVNWLFPFHFNDKVADMIAAIFAGVAFIVTRSIVTRRAA